ncbi:SUKH-4 family immunity protein [Streptomyces sp. NPDC085946]|uniref:SUKH-4 family immunity protein n=1 Tax=Streptomyces sp. NPDC085946 TaxID=3365744 RepID=UPI0037D519A6
MNCTDAGTATITPTGDAPDPYVPHAPARRRPAGPGLPGDGGVPGFAERCGQGPRPAAAPVRGPGGRLAAGPRDRSVAGGVAGPEAEPVLLGGVTGGVPTAYFFHDRPDPMDCRPLAPALPTLVRFAAAVDELAGLRGQLASRADRFGTEAVAGASRRLLALCEEGTGGTAAPLRRLAALIRPLALAAGPGTRSGLALDLPVRLLDEEFGRGRVVRFEDVDLPVTLTHEPTRRFLRETGLPEEGFLFRLDPDVPPRTLAEHAGEARAGEFPAGRLPARAGRLVRLGHLVGDTGLVVDGRTGAVLGFHEPEGTLHPLNTDVSTLAATLWLLHREHTVDEGSGHALTADLYDQLAMTMLQVLSAVDPSVASCR